MKSPLIIHSIFVRILNKLNLLPYFSLTTKITVNNTKIQIPITEKSGLTNLRLSESWMTELLLKLVPAFSSNFIDVGVNLGQTLLKAVTVFDNLSYIGFEPNPICYSYSKKIIALNNLKNCEVLPVGIGAKNEVLPLLFFSNENYDQSATILQGFRHDSTVVKREFVPVFSGESLNQFLPTSNGAFLKIDVEGSELEVIEGLIDWIANTRPIIITEILPVYAEDNLFRLNRQNKIADLLAVHQFIIARIKKSNDQISLFKLSSFDINTEIDDSDYLFVPKERELEIFSLFR